MRVGTRSVLYGAHAFWLHPFFVAEAWRRLYGFPWAPWLWVMFFVHDIGYLGKPNMDGREGASHPRVGAEILWWLQDWWECITVRPYRDPHAAGEGGWGWESMLHSRFLAKRYHMKPSRLCMADKLAITLTPWWLYMPMVIASREVEEYIIGAKTERHAHEHSQVAPVVKDSHPAIRRYGERGRWYAEIQVYLVDWVALHRDGREDTWTLSGKETN